MAYIFGSIWDRPNRNALNSLSKSVEQQGKSIQDLVAEGQLTPEQYATLIKSINNLAEKSEVRESTITRPINVAEMDAETKKLFTGGSVAVVGENSIGKDNIKTKVIVPEMTSFIEVGKNKFNGIFYPWEITGVQSNLNSMLLRTTATYRTGIIRLEPYKTYTIKKFRGGTRFRAGVFNKTPNPTAEGIAFDTPLYHSADESSAVQSFTFTNDGEGMYLCVYVGGGTSEVHLQVEEGATATEFEEYKAKVSEMISVYDERVNQITEKSPNLFSGYQQALSFTAGTPWRLAIDYAGFNTAVIEVEGNSTYHVRKTESSNRFSVGLSTSKVIGTAITSEIINDASVEYVKVETGPEENYLFITVSNTSQTPKLNVTKDIDYLDYVNPRPLINPESVYNLTEDNLSYNLVDFIKNRRQKIEGWSVGNINNSGVPTLATDRVRTDLIQVAAGDRIKTLNPTDLEGVYVFKYSLSDGSFVEAVHGYRYEYLVDEDCYVRLVSRYSDSRDIVDSSFFDGKFEIDYTKEKENKVKPILFGDFTNIYKTEPLEAANEGSAFDLGATVASEVHGWYDSLMAQYPDSISRNLLGYASNSTGEDDTNSPIYEYVFTAPDGESSLKSRPVKILLMTGIHGEEKSTVWSTYQFFSQMMNNDTLASIKSNVDFRVIPVANPFGYNQHDRFNARNVDINRNFSHRWEEDTAPRKGDAPYSEVETRILSDWMIGNADADMFIDFHNFSFEKPKLSYVDTMNDKIQNVYTSLIRRLSEQWRRDQTLDNDNAVYGFSHNDNRPMTFREAYHVAGIDESAIIEITMFWEGIKYTKEIVEMGVELLANYLLAMLNAYNI